MPTFKSYGFNQYRASEAHMLTADRMYKPNGTRRGIIFCHGVGQDATAVNASVAALAAAGYPVISCDLSATTYSKANWGNADHISAIGAAWTYLKSPFGAKTDKVGLLGSSMGAAGALAWARANLASVFAVGGTIPVLDVDDIYQNDRGGHRATVGTAYGVTYPTSLGSLATNSPVAFGSSDLLNIPVRLWASSDDTIASTSTACTTWGGKGASPFTVTSLGAVGHNGSSTSTSQVVQFFDDAGGRT